MSPLSEIVLKQLLNRLAFPIRTIPQGRCHPLAKCHHILRAIGSINTQCSLGRRAPAKAMLRLASTRPPLHFGTPPRVGRCFGRLLSMTHQTNCLSGKALAWRRHCEQAGPHRFDSLKMPLSQRRRGERYEEQLIEQLTAADMAENQRALALRAIVELRGCSTREVAQFFGIESAVVIRSLMLLKASESAPRVEYPVSKAA